MYINNIESEWICKENWIIFIGIEFTAYTTKLIKQILKPNAKFLHGNTEYQFPNICDRLTGLSQVKPLFHLSLFNLNTHIHTHTHLWIVESQNY